MAKKTVQVEPKAPVFVETEIEITEIEDDTNFILFWRTLEREFSSNVFNKPEFASSSFKWPSANNTGSFFKFSSFWIEQGQS